MLEKAERPSRPLGFFVAVLTAAVPSSAMNHNVVVRTPLDAASAKASGLSPLPFAEGLFRTKAAAGTLESADIESPAPFDNVVGSFAADVPPGGEVELSAKVRTSAGWSEWYVLGTQTSDGFASAPKSDDAAAALEVDELKLKSPASAARFRVRLRAGRRPVRLRSVALALSDASAPDAPPAPSTGPWTRELALAPRSQRDEQEKYKHDVCSPTSLAMVLEFWGEKKPTETVALAVRDRGSELFGNWPANAAYAASFGLDARVERLESISDLEREVAAGRPVVVSVTFGDGELPGAPIKRTSGHLVVVAGFTAAGDVVVFDPAGRGKGDVRHVYGRAAFHKAWRVNKRGLAYVIGPDLPRTLAVGVPVADLWRKPVRRAKVALDDDEHLSQLLYGETVTVLQAKGDWVRVRAEEQDSFLPASAWQGFPGWMRAEDLTAAAPPPANAVVRLRQALVHRGPDILTLSVGTRLDRLSESSGTARVRLLDGTIGEIGASELYVPPAEPTPASRAEIIRTAELFLGTSYYWGGRSGVQADPKIGVDCSGLVSLAYRLHGRDVPRDAHEQKLKARPIRSKELQAGDLVFLTDGETSDRVTHVMIFTGGDGLIESRKSSGRVLRTTFLERFGRAAANIESGDPVNDLSFAKPRRRRIFFGSYF
ncbi:MAG TPA: C39 family peptidase [Elusimicrobiota bacterium]|nr:C39 family peptidase [Elusimicrobiota bacterium]